MWKQQPDPDDVISDSLQARLWEMERRFREPHFHHRLISMASEEQEAFLMPLAYHLLLTLLVRREAMPTDPSGGYITLIEAYRDVERVITRLFPGTAFVRPTTVGDAGLAPEAELELMIQSARLLIEDLKRHFGLSDGDPDNQDDDQSDDEV